jgi:hypothetical protein
MMRRVRALLLLPVALTVAACQPTQGPPPTVVPGREAQERPDRWAPPDGLTVAKVASLIRDSTEAQISARYLKGISRTIAAGDRERVANALNGATFAPGCPIPTAVGTYPPVYELSLDVASRVLLVADGSPCLNLVYSDSYYTLSWPTNPEIFRLFQELLPVPSPRPDEIEYLLLATQMKRKDALVESTSRILAVVRGLLDGRSEASLADDTELQQELLFQVNGEELAVAVYRDHFRFRGKVLAVQGIGQYVLLQLQAG